MTYLTKTVFLNILILITFPNIMSYILPILSLLYVWHNIREQIITKFDGSVKNYLKSTIKLKKTKNG